ncbi:hypothetical protein MLD38_010780 [Melastoma candidum]|uniref:Uncharacterized protein n=1 Tax=Melastoma candidum TaxID=119954 RepID=A0ACB9R0K3_9MYRT|nr:hypothetical protein MLD38_010780 [Melastoma candidum]
MAEIEDSYDEQNVAEEYEQNPEPQAEADADAVDEAEEEEEEVEAEGEEAELERDEEEQNVADQNLDEAPEDDPQALGEENDDDSTAVAEKRWPGWPGDSVFRMLVPAQKVGSIIGRKGEFIKKIVEETRARIKILDGPPGTSERALLPYVMYGTFLITWFVAKIVMESMFSKFPLRRKVQVAGINFKSCLVLPTVPRSPSCYPVMVSAKEEPDNPLPPAVDGLLRVHKRIVDGLDGESSQPPAGGKTSTRLLIAASQAGSLIGKQGGTVKSIQEESNCVVRVLGTEELPIFALQDDRVVEVVGEPAGLHKAVELIASRLRKFLVDHSIIPLFEIHMQMTKNPPMDHMPPQQNWGPPHGLPPNAVGGFSFGPNPQHLPPPRQLDSYYPPPELPPLEQQTHQGISAYGREHIGMHGSSNAQAAPSMIKQITSQMQVPLSYADAVIGTSGSNISYIRRTSGATVTIQETRGAPGEMTVEISGSASQVQTAQQLIQNFLAEAAAPAQGQGAGPIDQGYNSYGAQGSMYASPASTGHNAHGGGYGSVYGANYGY